MVEAKNKLPLVSVIIPIYNRAWSIPETLDSIVEQIYKNWECIIVDDGSTDNTAEVVQEYVQKDKRIKYVIRPPEYLKGSNGPRNYGFDISKGEFIQWFDSDDIMLENFLSDKIDMFIQNPEYQMITSRHTFFEGDRKILKKQFQWIEAKDTVYENVVMWYMPMMPMDVIFRKDYLLATNEKFDESIKFYDEYDFFTRLLIQYPPKTTFIDKSLALVRRNNEDSLSTIFHKGKSKEMNETTYLGQIKLFNLLKQNNKLTRSIIMWSYTFHKELLTAALKNSQYDLAKKYKKLIDSYLITLNDKYDLAKFRLGYFLLKIIPIDNLFLNYKPYPLIHFFNRFISGNIKRIYKLLFVKGWLSEKMKEVFSKSNIKS